MTNFRKIQKSIIKNQNLGKKILLAHGSGGRLTHELINTLIRQKLSNPALDILDDSAIVKLTSTSLSTIRYPLSEIVFTTDSYVVKPIFFPGGDIGKLAVCGTVNDLAMKGAVPIALSCSAIIEEGLDISVLEKVVQSIATTAKQAGVNIVTGDTKVVEKGSTDGLFLNTSGIGVIPNKKINVSGHNAKIGDVIIVSGTMGDHEIAILNARQKLGFKSNIVSDCAPLNGLVQQMLKVVPDIHVMRDPTRGGLATTLNEIALQSNIGIEIEESLIPVNPAVRKVCELLGLDPLYLANEGKVVLIVKELQSSRVLRVMKKHSLGKNAAVIGKVTSDTGKVILNTDIGGKRIIQMLEGTQLPRIC